jgi:hypothetical protein
MTLPTEAQAGAISPRDPALLNATSSPPKRRVAVRRMSSVSRCVRQGTDAQSAPGAWWVRRQVTNYGLRSIARPVHRPPAVDLIDQSQTPPGMIAMTLDEKEFLLFRMSSIA